MLHWKEIVSGAVLMVSFYIVLFRRDDQRAREWAFGAIGVILGWFT